MSEENTTQSLQALEMLGSGWERTHDGWSYHVCIHIDTCPRCQRALSLLTVEPKPQECTMARIAKILEITNG